MKSLTSRTRIIALLRAVVAVAWVGFAWSTALAASLEEEEATPVVPGWRLITTEHYRVHYPAAAAPWAEQVASRLESVRARVAEEVGFNPPGRVRVIVDDPLSQPNGMAIPLLGGARMVLWATPPGPDSVIGTYRDWSEMLVTHEDAHLAHLLRPARNPLQAFISSIFGLGPVVRNSPRWVTEGYATYVEGKLTGSGRPHGDLRPTVLRTFARHGALPSYDEMSMSTRWYGTAFAYLMGSAFFDWLVDREGEDAPRKLWARMTAKTDRNFTDAFRGVFGYDPEVMYGRFVAELTRDAMAVEAALPPQLNPWLEQRGAMGGVSVSPDGSRVLGTPGERPMPRRLTVWEASPTGDPLATWREDVDKLRERDPLDVPPVLPRFVPPKEIAVRRRDGRPPVDARFIDAQRVLLSAATPDPQGRQRHDLFIWEPDTGRERRVTRLRDLHSADPAPDGSWAVAVQDRWGQRRLVHVNLSDGRVYPLTELSLAPVAFPRVSPDGHAIVWLAHQGGAWRIMRRASSGGPAREVPLPKGAHALGAPSWTPEGDAVVLPLGVDGMVEAWRVSLAGQPAAPLSSTGGAVQAVEVSPDGEHLFATVLHGRGEDVHRLPMSGPRASRPVTELERPPTPVLRREHAGDVPPPPEAQDVEPRRYGLGPPGVSQITSFVFNERGGSLELGARVGDLVGKHEVILIGALAGAEGLSGGGGWFRMRGRHGSLHVRAWAADERTMPWEVGGLVHLERRFHWSGGRLDFGFGALVDAPLYTDAGLRGAAYTHSELRHVHRTGIFRLRIEADTTLLGGARRGGGLGEGDGAIRVGAGFLGVGIALDALGTAAIGGGAQAIRLGGFDTTLLPEVASITRARVPWLPQSASVGGVRDGIGAGIGAPDAGAVIFIHRDRVTDPSALVEAGTQAWSAIGFRVATRGDDVPLMRIPKVGLDAGFACIVERPDMRFDTTVCGDIGNWTGWVAIRARP